MCEAAVKLDPNYARAWARDGRRGGYESGGGLLDIGTPDAYAAAGEALAAATGAERRHDDAGNA